MIKKEAEEMISIEVKEEQTEETPEYPKYVKHPDGTILVLTAPGVGTAIVGRDMTDNGEYSDNWAMGNFKPFYGTITIRIER